MTSYKTCAVHMCKSSTVKCPDKLFIHVPKCTKRRKQWLQLARRDPEFTSDKSAIFFCEDHFDLPNDMENYIQYSVMGSVGKIRMKPDCSPSKFQCQPDRIIPTAPPQPRSAITLSMTTDENIKVFISSITRTRKNSTNHYNDILNVEPATPIVYKTNSVKSCDYEPKNDKVYIPKKKTGSKVKTVRDIRLLFEKDVYSYLGNELETQKNFLLRKIRLGYSRNDKLREAAKKMLKSDSPVSKSIWRMLMNINPDDKTFSTQFVLWNGKNIHINGSKGGKNKLIYRYDISKTKTEMSLTCRSAYKDDTSNKKKALLQNSLHVKFKPGPLTKKKYLDTSYQKHNFGDIELVSLPKPGLEIQPTHGKPIPPAISAFLYHSFAENSNIISKNWADFAVSVLGTNVNGTPVQSKDTYNTTYDLSYKCTQNRLLMRHDSEMVSGGKSLCNNTKLNQGIQEDTIIFHVKNVINDILGAVEISLEQDNMYTGEDEPRDILAPERHNTSIQSKERMKKKYCELDRLDVTVITISEKTENKNKTCLNSYCNLGCICDSLSCSYNVKGHCGRIECMFQCTCDFSGYKISEFLERNNCTRFLPEIINKDKNSNLKLAKEEKKFHQTVIVTEEKSIVLKSRKRDWKTSKKYASFYNHMHLKTGKNLKKELCVVATKLDCSNIEPLCLVHNLYRCFCKCKFVDTAIGSCYDSTIEETKTIEQSGKSLPHLPDGIIGTKVSSVDFTSQNVKKSYNSQERTIKSLRIKSRMASQMSLSNEDLELPYETCARILAYDGRKYSNGYYSEMNGKIKKMEINDKTLQKKLDSIIDIKDHNSLDDTAISFKDITTNVDNSMSTSNTLVENPTNMLNSLNSKRFPNKSKLVAWLESSYKQFKLKADQGIVKSCLGPPQPGKLALYPWEFILSRYRERKNYFLVSNNKPFRLFMTVNEKKLFFESSININNIAWSDIDKYPITVKNLLTNATDLRDNFCILYGLSHSWELIGSVTKINENVASADVQILDTENKDFYNEVLYVENIHKNKTIISDKTEDLRLQKPDTKDVELNSESSKWFVMTVEDDFSEIQFYKKGFFVKYDSVIKAINVARVSNKTVRLSSQKCNIPQSDPQFGIYAIPSESDCCVFIGPYEKDEKLGIETINTCTDSRGKRTRGIWITTKKIDNLKVIDNPLSFLPTSSNNDNLIPLHSHITSSFQKRSDVVYAVQQNQNVIKTLKPIRICKTNGFYHLAPNGMLKQISQTSPDKSFLGTENKKCIPNNNADQSYRSTLYDLRALDRNDKCENKSLSESSYSNLNKTTFKKPIAEIAPQVKTSAPQMSVKRKLEGMFVLKPEEINKRSFEGKISTDNFLNDMFSNSNNITDINFSEDTHIELDIESFLATSVIKDAPNNEIYVISDDDEDNSETIPTCNWRCQYIICKNIENLGWIYGRRDSKNRLSFEFPGFKPTDFYSENDAFEKINQVFSRKVYVPKNITLEWRTSDDSSEVEGKHKLHKNELNADYMMTKKGLTHKSEILNRINLTQRNCETFEFEKNLLASTTKGEFMEKKNDLLKELEETSAELENESDVLWNETISKQTNLLDSLSGINSDVRQELSDMLKDIISVADNSENT